ncbi:MAG: alpha/beta hydrolase [Actinomycetota bacterium]|nr:alpha/beta hydrolase [Actinomycetota bacterium]
MQPEEVRAFGDLAGGAAAGVASQIRGVHQGIAGRVFGLLGPPAAPVRQVHDQIASGAYAGARALSGAVVRGGAFAVGLTRSSDAPSVEASVSGRLAVGAVNGAWGDHLERQVSRLARGMTLRRGGRDLSLDSDSLTAALPDASPRLVILLHGLCETDDAWRLRAHRHIPYGQRLESELGYTTLYLRYNSGLHISHNGRRLAALLDELSANWPVEISEIALVGHSMGGLVARSACHYAGEGSWREHVRHVFMLGTPHKGAPLERAANAACHGLSRLPETRPFATPLKLRSAGTKDLGYGYVVDEDWDGHDADAFWSNTGTVVPFLKSANHYFVSATLSRDAGAPLGRLVGDLLVLRPSAWSHEGHGERLQFPIDRYSHLGGATHFDLLNHPAVWGQIKRWLLAGRELSATV